MMNTQSIIDPIPIEIIRYILLHLTRRDQLVLCDTLSSTIHSLLHENEQFKQTVFEYSFSKVVRGFDLDSVTTVVRYNANNWVWVANLGFERIIELTFVYQPGLIDDSRITKIAFASLICDNVHILESLNKYVTLEKLDLDNRIKSGYTLLQTAAFNGCIKSFRWLVNNKADWQKGEYRYGQTPLHIGCGRVHPEIVNYCLNELHMDPNASDRDGYVPLTLVSTARQGSDDDRVSIIRMLLDAGADKSNIDPSFVRRIQSPAIRQLLNLS
jgi:hypothetical protein